MQTQQILSASILDILFDGRNKNYGAYDLRKNYNKRITYALSGTFVFCLLFTVGSILAKGKKTKAAIPIIELSLESYHKKDEVSIIEKPKEIIKPKAIKTIAEVAVTIPIITKNELVNEDNQMKQVEDLEGIKIGSANVKGENLGEGYVAPVENSIISNGEAKSIEPDYTKEFIHVEVTAQFPGGVEAWKKFLERNLNSSLPAENGAAAGKYSVIVSFVVDNGGNISEVKAENAPGFGTEEEAIRIIKKGPKWQPAMQNGRKVAYRVKQQITFIVNDN